MLRTYFDNHFLIAMPHLTDPRFYKSVSYLCEHNEDGAIGIVINRPMTIFLDEILEQIGITVTNPKTASIPVYAGGPVSEERGFVIHPPAGKWRSTLAASDQIHITTSQDILEAIAIGKGPEQFLIALGYAGWTCAQLEAEILQNSWLTVPATTHLLFNTPSHERWHYAASLLGIDIDSLSSDIGHA